MTDENYTEYKRGNGYANGYANARGGPTFNTADAPRPKVKLVCAADIVARPISWLWPGWLAAGKVHILGGIAGTGKTMLAMNMVATVTNGGTWPDGSRAPVGNCIVWSGEDGWEDTLKPRLMAAGADCNRVFAVDVVTESGGEKRPFDPAKDFGTLAEHLASVPNVKLLIVDPIVSAVAGDSHKSAEVRRGLQPLVDLAAGVGAALIGVSHFSKGSSGREPVERITGSLAFAALARIVMVAAKEQEGEDGSEGRRILARAKSNISSDVGGFAYYVEQVAASTDAGIIASIARFGDPIEGSAREMLANAETASDDDGGPGGAMDEAKGFLIDALVAGPIPVKKLQALARDAGQAWRTVKRAKQDLRIETQKGGMEAGWTWRLAEGGQENPKGATTKAWPPSENVGPLRHDDGGADL